MASVAPADDGPRRVVIGTSKALGLGEQYRNYVRQSWIEVSRNKCQFCLGCCSICLVVFVVCIALTTLSYAPILLLGLAEANTGEIDLELVPPGSPFNGINYTLINEIVSANGSSVMTYNTARYEVVEYVYAASMCTGFDAGNPDNGTWAYANATAVTSPEYDSSFCSGDPTNCVNTMCGLGIQATIVAINSVEEARIGIGREWTLPPVPKGSCYIYSSVSQRLHVTAGDYIILALDFADDMAWHATTAGYATAIDGLGFTYIPLLVNAVLSNGMGKFGSSISNAVVVEIDDLLSLVAEHADPAQRQIVTNAIAGQDIYDYVNDVLFNLPPPRYQYYESSDFPTIARGVISWASSITFLLGVNEVDSTLPVLGGLNSTKSSSSFLTLILDIIILLLTGISVLLIYSLLLVSVESRTFELGILRMIGLNRVGLVQLLLVHAMMFAVPAWAIGLLLGQFIYVGAARTLSNLTNFTISRLLTPEAIGVATVIGIVIPIVAAILPIRAALTKNLHDALDTTRSKIKAVVVTVERSTSDEYAVAALSVGVLISVVGFLIYYLLPLALLYSNLTLLFDIFLVILLGMLIGLVLLALNLQPLLESFLISLVFFVLYFENAAIAPVVRKNMMSHRLRNRKTAITYASALGFLIFLSVAVDLEINSIYYSTIQSNGAILSVNVDTTSDGMAVGISSAAELEIWAMNTSSVVDFAWISYDLQSCWDYRQAMTVQNVGQYVKFNVVLWGASPNLWEAFIDGYTSVSDSLPNSPYGLGEQLYAQEGNTGIITGEYFGSQFGIDDPTKEVFIVIRTDDIPIANVTMTPVVATGLLDETPYFTMTSFPGTFEDAVTNFPFFVSISNGQYNSVEEIPMRFFIIKLDSSLNDSGIDALIMTMPTLAFGQLNDVRGDFSFLVTQQATIQWIFQIVTIFTMIIAFFSLSTSMFTNIIEQTKEVGILRAIGLSQFPLFRIYIYEAFFLVMSSAILGGAIGLIIGWSLSAQRGLLTEIPIPFIFPWQLAITVFLVAIVSAVLSTVLPVWRLAMMPVVGIFRLK